MPTKKFLAGSFGGQTGKMTDAKDIQALADHSDCGLMNGLPLIKLCKKESQAKVNETSSNFSQTETWLKSHKKFKEKSGNVDESQVIWMT